MFILRGRKSWAGEPPHTAMLTSCFALLVGTDTDIPPLWMQLLTSSLLCLTISAADLLLIGLISFLASSQTGPPIKQAPSPDSSPKSRHLSVTFHWPLTLPSTAEGEWFLVPSNTGRCVQAGVSGEPCPKFLIVYCTNDANTVEIGSAIRGTATRGAQRRYKVRVPLPV